jgi:hypothetical protein
LAVVWGPRSSSSFAVRRLRIHIQRNGRRSFMRDCPGVLNMVSNMLESQTLMRLQAEELSEGRGIK